MENVLFKLEGMHCNGCVNSVKFALEDVPGVSEVTVTLTPQEASVQFDQTQTDIATLKKAITDSGYIVID